MRFHHMLPLLLGNPLMVMILSAIATARPTDCPDSCGNLTIPYPFGTRQGCYRDEYFLITCNDSTPFLKDSNLQVLDISLYGEFRISSWVASDCYNESGQVVNYEAFLYLFNYSISYKRNKFMSVGCDTYGYLQGYLEQKSFTNCMAYCNTIDDVIDGFCSGVGCCETAIPKGVLDFTLSVTSSNNNHSTVMSFNPCGFAFVVEEGKYNFSKVDLYNLSNIEKLPVVVDWALDNKTCEDAKMDVKTYACGKNSICYNSDNIPGYLCNCSDGYTGNPYLPDGCKDIDECLIPELNPCTNVSSKNVCHNINGSFYCSCPNGYHGDGKTIGRGCIPNDIWLKVTVGIGISILVLIVGSSWLYWGIKKRKLIQLKEKFFEQNGGLILQQKLSKLDGSVEAAKIFTIEELKKSTNDFDEKRIVGRGGFGIVYKGVLPQNKVVAIKKSLVVDKSQLDQFVNEVIVLSQINQRNVVKLLGCCLEAEVPLLVYEFITNGTLSRHIHEVDNMSIPWEIRLRIAKETAVALSYLHSETSIPIIHRDVKSTNILLDNNFTAKVSDFGASRLVPLDKTQLTTMVQGTLGYLDPEYFYTSQLSEKSDVYSFGVVLVELLTGKMAISFERPEKERNLATYFISSIQENRLSFILDHRIVIEDNVEQVREVANLAQSCLRLKGYDRPTMREVAIELEGLIRATKHLWNSLEENQEETEHLLRKSLDCGSTSITVGYDSLRNQEIIPLEVDGGR